MNYAEIAEASHAQHLEIFGAFHLMGDATDPVGAKTLVLLGPKEPGFWAHFQSCPEYQDNAADPMDRWSSRVISSLAHALNATAVFPFGGPPFQPFIAWAMKSGRAWQSPAGPLVHDSAGMMVSYRGALAFAQEIALPELPTCPCDSCTTKPCLTACPVSALYATTGYDLNRCHQHLESTAGEPCMTQGCAARRACPVSHAYARRSEQSAFHMKSFHPGANG